MNRIDFSQPGGFPLDQDVFGFMQQNIALAAQTSAFAGQLAILAGCEQVGGNVANGYVIINGEILPFVGTAVDQKVIIVEETNNLNYEDGEARPSEIVRYATFGDDGVTNHLWANFKRNTSEGVLARLERLERLSAPFNSGGGIVLFNKPAIEIPEGWREVIDFRGRVPFGYDPGQVEFDTVGKTGGAKGIKMVLANLIEHVHNFIKVQTQGAGGESGWVFGASQGNVTKATEKAGSADPTPMNVLNPYRVVVFIEPIPEIEL